MSSRTFNPALVAGIIIVLAIGAALAYRFLTADADIGGKKKQKLPTPVEVAAVQRGPLSLKRTFSGTIEPLAQFTVAPKVSGRIRRLTVDVSDSVDRGQTVAFLEDAEFMQAVVEAEALLSVAQAKLMEAESRLEIAQRQLDRAKALHTRGIASDSDLDSARAEFLAAQATVKVAAANLKREEAALAAAEIRLGYTRIQAEWEKGDDQRTVARRFADEGNTVAANTALYAIVELDPVVAVIRVTEKDYSLISIGQEAILHADAFPGRNFKGTVSRIAPIFQETTRQARVELIAANLDHLLKPGMFTRCTLELARVEHAVYVPEIAVTTRNNRTGVFLAADNGTTARWVEVEPGLKDGSRLQLVDSDLTGEVVTLGQQLIEDGSKIVIRGRASENDGETQSP